MRHDEWLRATKISRFSVAAPPKTGRESTRAPGGVILRVAASRYNHF